MKNACFFGSLAQNKAMNRFVLLAAHTLSIVLLYFGWFLDMLKMDISAHFIVNVNLFNEKRSVVGTLQSLWNSGNWFPFLLIFLFGILIPLLKTAAIYLLLIKPVPKKSHLSFVSGISKWAMADVFAISIFVAFLGANAMENTKANLEAGFYFFTAYVLASAVIAFFVVRDARGKLTSV